MSLPAAPTARRMNIFSRFRRNRQGSAAVEFAFVAPVFIALVYAIIEASIVFLAGQVLESINEVAARQIETGQAQGANYQTLSDFKTAVVCPQIPAFFTCGNIYVNVQSAASPANVNFLSPVTNGNFDPSQLAYNPGGSCAIVVVQLFYQWPMIVMTQFSNLNGNLHLLQATAAFRNEPYSGACAT